MPRFTRHAYRRYRRRRLELVPRRYPLYDPVQQAHESFQLGQLLSRQEAAARINGPVYPGSGDFYFRADGTGKGVWVACLRRGQELVVTYLGVRPHRPAHMFLLPQRIPRRKDA